MYPRTEYQMSEEQLKVLMSACQTVACIAVGGIAPRSQQENANSAWQHLGVKMGFDSMTVKPINGKGVEFFTAIPSENEIDQAKRKEKEFQADIAKQISQSEQEGRDLQVKINDLKSKLTN